MSQEQDFLLAWHRDHAGRSKALLSAGRTPAGASSYELLAATVPGGAEGLAVLDLGCGDGELLAHVARRVGPGCRLVGVDMSIEELAAASVRPELRSSLLVLERAQDLSLPAARFDVVLSHMALALMDDVDAVLASAARVLRPGGTFAAITGLSPVATGGWEAFSGAMAAAGPTRDLDFGDARARSARGMRDLLAGHFRDPEARELSLDLGGSPDRVWERLSSGYLPELLDEDARLRLREGFFLRAKGRPHLDLVMGIVHATAHT